MSTQHKKVSALVILVVLLVSAIGITAAKMERQGPDGKIKAYFQKNVKPVLDEKRRKLESSLSAEEKSRVDSARNILLRVRHERKKEGLTLKDIYQTEGSDWKISEATELIFSEHGAQIREAMQILLPVVENHEDAIYQQMEALEPHLAKWRENIKSMAAIGDEKGILGIKKTVRHYVRANIKHTYGPVLFLAYDPGANFLENEEGNTPRKQSFSLFPNPSATHFKITFEGAPDQLLQLTIKNHKGRELSQDNVFTNEKGLFSRSFDTQTWEPGIYLVTIQSPTGKSTKQYIKE